MRKCIAKKYVDENSRIVNFLFPKGEGCRNPTDFLILKDKTSKVEQKRLRKS